MAPPKTGLRRITDRPYAPAAIPMIVFNIAMVKKKNPSKWSKKRNNLHSFHDVCGTVQVVRVRK
jgi:hypothetical protein